MNTLNQTLDEKMRIDEELAEMDKYPINFSDIPPMQDADSQRLRFGHERFLKMLPPDIVSEMASRRLNQIKDVDYAVPEPLEAVV
jgi:hypothetical protein